MDDVKQVDRDAAADQFRYLGGDMKSMREGLMDGNSLVQAFAHHRIAAEAASEAKQAAEIAELRELLRESREALIDFDQNHGRFDELTDHIDTALKDTTS